MLRRIAATLGRLYAAFKLWKCRNFHHDISLPLNGHYLCWTCNCVFSTKDIIHYEGRYRALNGSNGR